MPEETKSKTAPKPNKIARKQKEGVEGLRGGATRQFGYEYYTQDTNEHAKGYMTALNRRFPNLVGFGILQFLKQLMAKNPRAKILWDHDNITAMCDQMNIDRALFMEVMDYCMNQIKIISTTHSWLGLTMQDTVFLVYPDFQSELIRLQIKKINEEASVEINDFKGAIGGETTSMERKRMIAEMKMFLVLTDAIKDNIINFYPMAGSPEQLWKIFIDEVEFNHLKWHAILNPDNYEPMLYTFLNNLRPTKAEAKSGKF